jgi:mRNA-degrading endonuclease YafQ of YafQ-DinJ toxin-antitoxin module
MEYEINSTKQFEKDMLRFSEEEKVKIINKINNLITYKMENRRIDNYIHKFKNINLKYNLKDSLYVFKINLNIRAIISIENDPLFNKNRITLYRIARHDEFDASAKSVINSLYSTIIKYDGEDNASN